MGRNTRDELCTLVRCDFLHGIWRSSHPEPFHLYSRALKSISSRLAWGGVLALLEPRIAKLGNISPIIRKRVTDYSRVVAMRSLQHEMHITSLFHELRRAGIEPVLIKGWSTARHYADPTRRDTLDVDICVSQSELRSARRCIAKLGLPYGLVDLHAGIDNLNGRTWETTFDRTQLIELDGTSIRVLCHEDQLRLACLHFWRHRCIRPLWLCDIAAIAESARPDFDWGQCFAGTRRDEERIKATLGLAHQLLGARVDAVWFDDMLRRLPNWLARSVLARWGLVPPDRHAAKHPVGMMFDPNDPIRTVNRLGIGPFHSEIGIKLLTRGIQPLVWAIRFLSNVTARSDQQEMRSGVLTHRRSVA